MKLSHLKELTSKTTKQVSEAKNEYEDSAEFTGEFYNLNDDLKKIAKIIKSKRFENWMKDTDSNFGTHSMQTYNSVKLDLSKLFSSFDTLIDEVESAYQ